MTDRKLEFLRCIDKLDRLGRDGVRDLLTTGRRDASGDVTPGLGLNPRVADEALGVFSIKGRDNFDTIRRMEAWFARMAVVNAICRLPEAEFGRVLQALEAAGSEAPAA